MKYPALDILRFFAALMVACHHLIASNTNSDFWHVFVLDQRAIKDFYSQLPSFWFTGYIGVQIFFSISGYIISVSASNSRTPLRFIQGRFLRVMPALWLCTLAILPIYIIFGVIPEREIAIRALRSLFLVPFGSYLDGVVWTIVVELAFYLLVFVFITFRDRKHLFFLGYALILASSTYWVLETIFPAPLDSRVVAQLARRLLLEHGVFFGVGMILAPRSGERRLTIADGVLLSLAVPGAYLQICASSLFVYTSGGSSHGASADPALPFVLWFLSVVILFLSTYLTSLRQLKADVRGIRKLGLMTYPMYLLHVTYGNLAYALLSTMSGLPIWACLALAILSVITLALIVALWIEPAVKWVTAPLFELVFGYIEYRFRWWRPIPLEDRLADHADSLEETKVR